jgi:hypothetical protein
MMMEELMEGVDDEEELMEGDGRCRTWLRS